MELKEQEIPIDIQVSKLIDWLITRRIVPHDWRMKVMPIRYNIKIAIQDMPPVDEIAQLLTGSYINYFHCCQIVNLLKETEKGSKNIFGQYSSKRMKLWVEIMRQYEKDNIYLADAAQILFRNIMYEIPSFKKQISKCKQTQEDCIKKDAEFIKKINVLREQYAQSCTLFGIEGVNIKKELMILLNELPGLLNHIASQAKDLVPIKDYYLSFLNCIYREGENVSLPLIDYIIKKGNTTVYEYRTSEVPDIIEGTTPSIPLDVDNGSSITEEDQIDFGETQINSESGDDSSSISPIEFVHLEKEDYKTDSIQPDFGETLNIRGISPITIMADANSTVKIARGVDALTLLENQSTRNSLHYELLELEVFLDWHLAELKKRETSADVLQFELAPSNLQLPSLSSIKQMLCTVKEFSSQLMSPKLMHLYLIKESPSYVDRTVKTFKNKLDRIEQLVSDQKTFKVIFQQSIEAEKELESKLTLITDKTKLLLKQIQDEISKRYKNRPVNIMGVLNVL